MYCDPSIWLHLGKVKHKPIAETPNCHQLHTLGCKITWPAKQGQCQRLTFLHHPMSGPQHGHSHQAVGEGLREVSLGHCFPRKYTAQLRAGNLLGGTPQLEWIMARLHGHPTKWLENAPGYKMFKKLLLEIDTFIGLIEMPQAK